MTAPGLHRRRAAQNRERIGEALHHGAAEDAIERGIGKGESGDVGVCERHRRRTGIEIYTDRMVAQTGRDRGGSATEVNDAHLGPDMLKEEGSVRIGCAPGMARAVTIVDELLEPSRDDIAASLVSCLRQAAWFPPHYEKRPTTYGGGRFGAGPGDHARGGCLPSGAAGRAKWTRKATWPVAPLSSEDVG